MTSEMYADTIANEYECEAIDRILKGNPNSLDLFLFPNEQHLEQHWYYQLMKNKEN